MPARCESLSRRWPMTRELEHACQRLRTEIEGFDYGGCRFSLLNIHADESPRGTVIRPHRHSHCEIILALCGSARETLPPERRIEPGTLQIHGPGDLHAWHAPRQSLLRIGFLLSMQPSTPLRLPEVWPLHSEFENETRLLLGDSISLLPGRRERLKARLLLLLAPALNLFDLPESPAVPPLPHDDAPGVADFVERFLADNLRESLTLGDVAVQFNMSVPTLTRRFRKETGTSVMARLQGLRLAHAAELLREGRLSVKEAGAAVGIHESSYFCRCFRRTYGVSPGKILRTSQQAVRPGSASGAIQPACSRNQGIIDG